VNHPARRHNRPLSIRHPRLYERLGFFLFVLGFTLLVVTAGMVSWVLLRLLRVPDETALNVALGCSLITFCTLYSWTCRYREHKRSRSHEAQR
jgi:cytochrome c biogenesis protein CcdA